MTRRVATLHRAHCRLDALGRGRAGVCVGLPPGQLVQPGRQAIGLPQRQATRRARRQFLRRVQHSQRPRLGSQRQRSPHHACIADHVNQDRTALAGHLRPAIAVAGLVVALLQAVPEFFKIAKKAD